MLYLRSPGPWLVAVLLAALALAWDAAGLDLPLARLAGGTAGFPLRDHWLLAGVLHEGGRTLGWLACLWLLAGIRWPLGPLRALPRTERAAWLAVTLLCLAAVNLAKFQSRSSCPWDLSAFGGPAAYLSHWAWGGMDGGPGHCFPAGHASAGFAFLGGYFALRPYGEPLARRWALGAFAIGLLLGLGQQWRGAHFMSHTLWTAWLCWTVPLLLDALARYWRRAPQGAPA